MIANTMVEKAFKAGKLTKEERVKLQDSIEGNFTPDSTAQIY